MVKFLKRCFFDCWLWSITIFMLLVSEILGEISNMTPLIADVRTSNTSAQSDGNFHLVVFVRYHGENMAKTAATKLC